MDVNCRATEAYDEEAARPLHSACYSSSRNSATIVELLVENGADSNQCYNGVPVLHDLCKCPHRPRFPYYYSLDSGLDKSSLKRCTQARQVLVSNGAHVKAEDEDGRTPLHCLVDSLAAKDADCDIRPCPKNFVTAGACILAKYKQGKSPTDLASGEVLDELQRT